MPDFKSYRVMWLITLLVVLGCWGYNSCDFQPDRRKEQCEARKCTGTLTAKWISNRYNNECLYVQLPEP